MSGRNTSVMEFFVEKFKDEVQICCDGFYDGELLPPTCCCLSVCKICEFVFYVGISI